MTLIEQPDFPSLVTEYRHSPVTGMWTASREGAEGWGVSRTEALMDLEMKLANRAAREAVSVS